jgi:hypothetical protein
MLRISACLANGYLNSYLRKECGRNCSLINTYMAKHCLKYRQNQKIRLFWKGLMGVKNEFFNRGSFCVGDGTGTRFWEDTWLGDTSLANQYPTLYNIVRTKNILVADVLSHNPLNIRFNRILVGEKWDAWIHLVTRLMNIQLTLCMPIV